MKKDRESIIDWVTKSIKKINWGKIKKSIIGHHFNKIRSIYLKGIILLYHN